MKRRLWFAAVCVTFVVVYCIPQAGLAVDIDPNFEGSICDAQQAVIEAKIEQWEDRLPHQDPEHEVDINFKKEVLGTKAAGFYPGVEFVLADTGAPGILGMAGQPTLARSGAFRYDDDGKPIRGTIIINDDPGISWYVDSNDPPAAPGGSVPAGQYDLWTVINHELAHALGFAIKCPPFAAAVDYIDPNDPNNSLRTYNAGGDPNAILVPEPDGTHLHPGYHPNDLMNPVIPTGVRRYPSEIDVNMLKHSVWGYTCQDVNSAGHSLESDLNGDCYVDYEDFETVVHYWLNNDCGSYDNCEGADFEPTDGIVDLSDFVIFANQWMQCNDPQDENCMAYW